MKKRLVSIMLALCLAVSFMVVPAGAAQTLPFTDVSPNAWYYSYVLRAYEEGLMAGVGNNRFDPNGVLTREQFVTILASMSGDDLSPYQNASVPQASDVASGQWYTAYVAWAYDSGITAGVSDTSFGLGQPVTREQMATFIHKYTRTYGVSLKTVEKVSSFKDAGRISSWAVNSVEAMRMAGIFNGDNNGNFCPQSYATRAEAATVFCALLDAIVDTEGMFEDFYADVYDILVGESETVTFFALISSECEDVPDAVSLCNAEGKELSKMYDDGNGNDKTAGDRIYTAGLMLASGEQTITHYHAQYDGASSTDLGISFYLNLTEEQLSAGDAVMVSLYDIAGKYAETDDGDINIERAKQSYQEIAQYLDNAVQSGRVVSYTPETDGIHFVMYGNLEYVFMYEALLSDSGAVTYSEAGEAVSFSVAGAPETAAAKIANPEICVLEPFEWQHPSSAMNNAAQAIASAGLNYKDSAQLVDEEVTLETMKQWGQYHIILLDSHGGINSFCTGEVATPEKNQAYSKEWQAGLIQVCGVSGDNTKRSYYAVTDAFFNTYYRAGSLKNSLIYLGTCHGADDPALGEELRRAGASTVLAYKNSVYTSYCEEMCEEVAENLCEKDASGDYCTVSAAVESAKSTLGEKDRKYSWIDYVVAFILGEQLDDPAELCLLGASDFRLSDYKQDEVDNSICEYPSSQKYWVIFREGYRNGRMEMSTVDSEVPEDELYLVWNKNLLLSNSEGMSRCNQYYLNGDGQWEYIGNYRILTDWALEIIASNLDIYDSNGNLVIAKSEYSDVDLDS